MYTEMTGVSRETVLDFYGKIRMLRKEYAFNDPVRQGAIRAYAYVNGHIAITALSLAAVPFVATFFMPDFYLGKQQNAVTNTGLDGELVSIPERRPEIESNVGSGNAALIPFYRRWLLAYQRDG
jgi:hypothetical protein